MEEKKDEQLMNEQAQSAPEAAENTAPAEPVLSPEEQLKAELAEQNDKFLRLYAEFDNFKRRTAKERIELIKTAGAEVLGSMLSVLDDFDRAQKSIMEATDTNAVKEGLNLVHHKLKTTLSAQGLKEMESSIGKTFDTDFHEAVTNIPAPSEDLKGKVIDELEKGYMLNDKVIRFAKVVVGS